MSYQPRPGSVPYKALQYFAKNPMAKMSTAELIKVLDCDSGSNLQGSLDGARKSGQVCFQDGYWFKGDAPIQLNAGSFAGWLEKKALKSAEGRGAAAALPDPASLQIEPGVPIPQPLSKRTLQYQVVFSAMQVGDSFKCDNSAATPLITSASKWGKSIGRKFTVRRLSETESRIWRTE